MNGATVDRLLDGRVHLEQPAGGYRAAIDPVLLAAAVPARAGERVLDLGCGVGAASLCLAVRVAGVRVVGLDMQPGLVALARANAEATGVADRVSAVEGDLRNPPPAVAAGGFDRVMANPPYLKAGTHTPPPDPSRAAAHGEGEADLAAWVAACARLVRPRGTVTLIHRADRFAELAALLHRGFGGIVLFPLWPKAGVPARRVVVQARRGARSPAHIAPGLVLHRPDGAFTAEAEEILRQGHGLSVGP